MKLNFSYSRLQENVYGILHGTLTPVIPLHLLPSHLTNDGQSGPSGLLLIDESTAISLNWLNLSHNSCKTFL
jgi:hypothetical protein